MTSDIRDWLFRNRQTGEITIAQAPNAALIVWLVAAAINLLFDPAGALGTAVRVIATGALVIWAGDELIRGVNPFRRMLGAVVLIWLIVGFASH